MACLRKRKRKRGFVWIIDYYDNDHKRHWFNTQTSSRKVAEQMMAKIELDLALGTLELPGRKMQVTLSKLKESYLTYSRSAHEKATYELNERFLTYFIRFAGDVRLDKITRKEVEDYKIYRQERVSKTSVNMELRHLKAAFSYAAVVRGYIKVNPFSGVKQIKIKGKNLAIYLKVEEVGKVLKVIENPRFKSLILFYLNTGCRRGRGPGPFVGRCGP